MSVLSTLCTQSVVVLVHMTVTAYVLTSRPAQCLSLPGVFHIPCLSSAQAFVYCFSSDTFLKGKRIAGNVSRFHLLSRDKAF
jgi:hypothetical protein